MSGSAGALVGLAIIQQLKVYTERLIEVLKGLTFGEPDQIVVNVAMSQKGEPIGDVQYKSTNAITPQSLFIYTVPNGYKVKLKELSIAPNANANTYGRFNIKIGGLTLSGVQLITTLTLNFDWLELLEGSVIAVWVYSSDIAQTVVCNAMYNAVRERTNL